MLFDFELHQLNSDYEFVETFIKKYNLIDYIQFDYHIVHDANLFLSHQNYDFVKLENTLDEIIKYLGAIKRIFARPIIRLKDNMDILPVENVKLINNASIIHASSHAELWDNISKDGIKPKKLLTFNNQDDYGIYENVVFVMCINHILSYVRKNIRILKDFIYLGEDITSKRRYHHIDYFLAVGKLQSGYLRNNDRYYNITLRCLNKLNFINNTIKARLINPVYKKVKVPHKKIVLKKTNIFIHHKDYKRIYQLLKFFDNNENLIQYDELSKLEENYFYYCELLTLFAIFHYNFKENLPSKIDFNNLNVDFKYKKWELNLRQSSCKGNKVLLLKVKCDFEYRILIYPKGQIDQNIDINNIDFRAEEKVIFSFDENDNNIHISLTDINSFLRIQQLVLKAMIYSDNKKDICPICGNTLEKINNNTHNEYICYACHNQIIEMNCRLNKKKFFATKIYNYDLSNNEEYFSSNSKENLMYYRNITKINDNLDIICPYCNKIHL